MILNCMYDQLIKKIYLTLMKKMPKKLDRGMNRSKVDFNFVFSIMCLKIIFQQMKFVKHFMNDFLDNSPKVEQVTNKADA